LAAPESTLSFTAAAKEILQTKYTLSPNWGADIYHTSIVRKNLTRQIPKLVDEMVDELDAALTDNIPLTDGKQSLLFLIFLIPPWFCPIADDRMVTPCGLRERFEYRRESEQSCLRWSTFVYNLIKKKA
jgi:hypothetical protein